MSDAVLDPAAGSPARREFARIASLADAEIDLAEAALWIAAEAYPGLHPARELRRLDQLADRCRAGVDAADDEAGRVAALNRALFVDEGFRGDRESYYDPRNSYLNDVLERKRGIPITLCVLYVEVAQRLGFHASGIGFPGHFLAKVVGSREVVVDPFEGRVVSPFECAERLRQALGPEAVFDRSSLAPAGAKQTLARMLNNLKQVHVEARDLPAALGCCERILMLAPDAVLERRDRGLLYNELECFGAALADLEAFLRDAPGHPSASGVRAMLPELRDRARSLH